ncbi:MAG: hypothetical protein ACYC3L_00850 [Gemmatimonadaceae bacterium]
MTDKFTGKVTGDLAEWLAIAADNACRELLGLPPSQPLETEAEFLARQAAAREVEREKWGRR